MMLLPDLQSLSSVVLAGIQVCKNAENAENVRKTDEKMQKSLVGKGPAMQSWSPHTRLRIYLTSKDQQKCRKCRKCQENQ